MPKYTTQSVPNTPLVRVMADGGYAQEFTSLYAAQCWIKHTESLHKAWQEEDPRFVDAYGDECQCYGCATMRHPCVNDPRT